MNKEKIQEFIKKVYGKIAQNKVGCGCDCSCGNDAKNFAKAIGYSDDELKAIPNEANLALSCGNPTAIAGLNPGETVLDLGSGAGFDCFLAASKVGPQGKVIGVDMTPEMIQKAKDNAKKNHISNVEFRLGEIEKLPIENDFIDVVISNCVINLSADKPQVFREIFRVLKPGGRIAISDITLLKPLPKNIRESIDAYVGCVSGAILMDDYQQMIEDAGFNHVALKPDTKDPMGKAMLEGLGSGEFLAEYVVSAIIEGLK